MELKYTKYKFKIVEETEIPIKAEVFGITHLEKHALLVAKSHLLSSKPNRKVNLVSRVEDNELVLLSSFLSIGESVTLERAITPAAEWLLDNFYIVEEQIKDIRDHLPIKYYNELPQLLNNDLIGYPRIYAIALEYIAHTDSTFDRESLKSFLMSYQQETILTMGELWAISLTVKIVLIENLRRISVQIVKSQLDRAHADNIADEVLGLTSSKKINAVELIKTLVQKPIRHAFVVQLIQRLRFQEGECENILIWLDENISNENFAIENVIQIVHGNHSASNVTVKNIITSMKSMNSLDWRDFFEETSLVNIKFLENESFLKMDFVTRDKYRHAIEELSRGSNFTEIEIAKKLDEKILRLSKSIVANNKLSCSKQLDLGFYLISSGRYQFEKEVKFKVKLRGTFLRWFMQNKNFIYFGSIILFSFLLVLISVGEFSIYKRPIILYFLSFFPALEIVITLINRLTINWIVPRHLPRFDFSQKIPEEFKTFIVVPTMLINEECILHQVEQLEVYFLSNSDDALYFGILTDWCDSKNESQPNDQFLLSIATKQILYLNNKYGFTSNGELRFYIFHRKRQWNPGEDCWMGLERKRGKLHEFNRLLRGDKETTFQLSQDEILALPENIKFVLTLDSDTKLPRGVASKMIGTLAHPLNAPIFDEVLNKVVEGYGILQPRITPTIPIRTENSYFQKLTSGACGVDPYAFAVSDIYQDLFGEGSYTGKGLYNLDVFEKALKGRTPKNRLLSHDLFEGNFVRCALLNDVEFFEDFPSNFEVVSKRNHRWIRGDWQLLPWILGREGRSISFVGRWKMLDNLRRSLLIPIIFLLLTTSLIIETINVKPIVFLILFSLGLPYLLPFIGLLFSFGRKISARSIYKNFVEDLFYGIINLSLEIIFIPYKAYVHLDAIFRTCFRLCISKSKLLEWTTSAATKLNSSVSLSYFYNRMILPQLLALFTMVIVLLTSKVHFVFVLLLSALWMCSFIFAWWISLPFKSIKKNLINKSDELYLINCARSIWYFFNTFVTKDENYLPPDNYQLIPIATIAHRSSPTNFGLYLMSVVAAKDFLWIGHVEFENRLRQTLESMDSLNKHNGHFFNWYDTLTRQPLEPRYISSVDNGNLAGHLIAVAQSCEDIAGTILNQKKFYTPYKEVLIDIEIQISNIIKLVSNDLKNESDLRFSKLRLKIFQEADSVTNYWEIILFEFEVFSKYISDTVLIKDELIQKQLTLVRDQLVSHSNDFIYFANAKEQSPQIVYVNQLIKTSKLCRKLLNEMDFNFLYDSRTKLFSIGYNMQSLKLDESYYDLLASEARLLSFVGIAKGDVPVEHWFRLGRAVTVRKDKLALISWSGSMFEYLMPSLVMKSPESSMIEETCLNIVNKQIQYADKLGIPWGMSESAFSTRDVHFTYQYSNFGIPELAFKRGIGKEIVIAPYATLLAGIFDPVAAVKNLKRMSSMNFFGLFGFFESIDFTKSRLPENESFVIVQTFMAHHQGMSLVAISNILHENIMIKRFHQEPMVQACELLLQERIPRNIYSAKSRVESIKFDHVKSVNENHYRQYFSPHYQVPRTHLLSNGHYAVMLTTAGSGYSKYCDTGITRWKSDTTCDNHGSYFYVKNLASGEVWSAGYQPVCKELDNYEVIFTEDRAKIIGSNDDILSKLEVFVSPDDNAEVRRLFFTNNQEEKVTLQITSYSEIILNTQEADSAHPVFSNLFVETDFIPEINSILVTRRTRSEHEKQNWLAQVVISDANFLNEIEYETDRMKFIGRGRNLKNPLALSKKNLTNSKGAILDPIISFRNCIQLNPGETSSITYSTLIGTTKEEVLKLAEKFHEKNTFERSSNLAWTESLVKLHYLGIDYGEANLFQQLANRILFLDPTLRPSSEMLKKNTRNASHLWRYGISGDFPIVLLRIEDLDQRNLAKQLLRAHEYWGTKRLDVDLVILNDKSNSYSQELHNSLTSLISSSRLALGSFLPNSKGKVFLLQTDLLPIEDRSMFQAVACAILIANQGSLSEQVKRMIRKIEIPNRSKKITTTSENISNSSLKNSDLEFYNEIGGFDVDNNEYVINLKNNIVTPLPWINVIANESFGFQVSESGAGYTWSKNSRENQLTPWTNDPVIDLTGECFYFYDMDTFELWSPTLAPIRIENANYAIRNGQGYSIFEVSHNGILSNLTQFVHPFLSLKISKIYLKNDHKIKKNIKVTSYNELVLGFTRSNSSRFIVTGYDFESEKMIAQNPWSQEFSQCVLFAGFVDGNDSWTGNRKEFIGRNSELSNPISFANNKRLSKKVGAGFDSCAAIDKEITLLPGEEKVLVFVLGQGDDIHKARYFSQIVTTSNVDEIFISTKNKWKKLLNQIQIETPNIAMNILVNHWLLYQTISCRLWARSAFYQSGGAFGFRDQLQDSMATIWVNPDLTKSQILKAAARQFVEGDVQHWWHLPSGRGVRTHFSDDLLWLPFIVTYYLEHTHDQLILEMEVPFISGTLLEKNREDSYFIPDSTLDFGNIYEHCARALDYSLSTGIHGLPLIGGGDWNDGMNRVGHAGKGESVWLTWFLISNLESFSKLANQRGEILRYEKWKHHIQLLKVAVEASAWDGEWYKRAFYDDGTPLGSRESEECVIDSISQSWAVISGAANVERTKTAMDSVEKKLINYEKKLILLFTPPFNKTLKDPGYIKGYLPGVRENGGQYTHAAIWNALAFSKLKNGNKAVELFDLLNPINHTSSLNEVLEYKVEPYVMAADIYSVSPNEGRGGWTWYTGAAGWMYTLAIENILGLKIQGKTLTIDPCIHSDWDFYKICYQYIDTKYEIEVKNPNKLQTGLRRTVHDGQVLDKSKDSINLINDLKIHYISIELY